MKKLLSTLALSFLVATTGFAQAGEDLPDEQYYGYKIVHHMGLVVEHIEKYGFNTFNHPRIADFRSFVITPALDHFYSKAVVDLRFGPAIVDVPAKDDRYSSIEIFCMEHFAIYDKVTAKDGERFVLVHERNQTFHLCFYVPSLLSSITTRWPMRFVTKHGL